MVTVDDLVISLTIKETSKLGKLQKQLKDLQTGKLTQKGFDNEIRNMFSKIRIKLRSLIGNLIATPTKPAAMVAQAGALRETILKSKREYAMKLIEIGGEEAMKEEWGVETTDQLINALEGKLDEWVKRLDFIIEKQWITEKASSFMASIDDFVRRGEIEKDKRKTFIKEIDSRITEFQNEIIKMFKAVGIKVIPQFTAYTLLKPFEEKVVRPGGGEWVSREMVKRILKIDKDSKELFDKLKPAFNNAISVFDYLQRATDILELEPTAGMFETTGAGIRRKEELKAMAADMFYLWETKFKGKGGIPSGFHTLFFDVLKANFPVLMKSEIFKQHRVDIAVIKGQYEKIERLFGKNVAEAIKGLNYGFIELKKELNKTDVDQFERYKEVYGNIIGIASTVKKSFLDLMPDIVSKQINVLTELEELGKHQSLTNEKVEELIKIAEKDFNTEMITSVIEKVINKGLGSLAKDEDLQQALKILVNLITGIKEKKIEGGGIPEGM